MTLPDERSSSGDPATQEVVALVHDLFMEVRVESTLAKNGWRPVMLRPSDDMAASLAGRTPVAILVDLQSPTDSWQALLRAAEAIPSGRPPAIAFGSHMDLQARKEALEHGALLVIANSKLVNDLPRVLRRYATAAAAPG